MLTDDGRTTDNGDYHPMSSPGAFGSGELKMLSPEEVQSPKLYTILDF